MQKLIVGNWKMNGLTAQMDDVAAIAACAAKYANVDSGLCLPATLIQTAAAANTGFAVGGQDCHYDSSGAHTGCISAAMLVDAGAKMVIVGHSERRANQGESDADICRKALAALGAGLSVIICVGETEAQRDAGQAEAVVIAQIDASLPELADVADDAAISVAYEPVWAIGTGRIPSSQDVAQMHAAIRDRLAARYGVIGQMMRILYGGSMNGDNAAELLRIPHVGGGLIGGASLTAAKFEPILAAASIA